MREEEGERWGRKKENDEGGRRRTMREVEGER